MKNFTSALVLLAALGFTACKGHSKKIIVYATGNIQVDATQTNITIGNGTSQHEQEISYNNGDPVTLNVSAASGKLTLQAPDDGLYIANLKQNDTIIGSFQRVGDDNGGEKISQEALKIKLDSLQKLVANQNVSAANKNYYILPNTIAKISGESKAKAFGPYTTIPGAFDAGSVPEIYKFYSIREIREIIVNLNKMTGETKPAEEKK